MITTARLYLIATNLPILEAIADEKWSDLSVILGGTDTAEGWLHFPDAMIWLRDYLREYPAEIGWWNYLIIHQDDNRIIGSCGYKGPPSVYDGAVEIGYEMSPQYQSKGYATEAAKALCDHAFSHPEVKMVKAQTLDEENASVALLRKLRFQFLGESVDIEEGIIWEWRLER